MGGGWVFFVSLKKYCNTLFLLLFLTWALILLIYFLSFIKKKRQNRAAKKADFFFQFCLINITGDNEIFLAPKIQATEFDLERSRD